MKISKIETFPVRYPTKGRFKFFESHDGKPLGRPAVFVKITADDGSVGWGQSVPIEKWSYETIESVVATIKYHLAPILIGRNPFEFEEIHALMNYAIAPGFSTGMPKAKAGIDIALHDLVCRKLGVSLAQYWERPQVKSLTLSWTLNPASLNDVDRLIDEGLEKGYKNFNVKIAPDVDFDLKLCKKVKERVPDGFLWADANCGYDVKTALEAAPELKAVGVAVFESPLRPNFITGYQRLKQQGAMLIIMDEGVIAPRDLIEFNELGMMDGVAMKPARCGGLLSARQQIEIMQKFGLMFLGSGLTDPDVSLAAMAALYGAYGLEYPAALNGPQFLDFQVLKEPLQVVNGQLMIPKGPGLGVEVDEERIKTISVDVKL